MSLSRINTCDSYPIMQLIFNKEIDNGIVNLFVI
jgi:hypothetical protein